MGYKQAITILHGEIFVREQLDERMLLKFKATRDVDSSIFISTQINRINWENIREIGYFGFIDIHPSILINHVNFLSNRNQHFFPIMIRMDGSHIVFEIEILDFALTFHFEERYGARISRHINFIVVFIPQD